VAGGCAGAAPVSGWSSAGAWSRGVRLRRLRLLLRVGVRVRLLWLVVVVVVSGGVSVRVPGLGGSCCR